MAGGATIHNYSNANINTTAAAEEEARRSRNAAMDGMERKIRMLNNRVKVKLIKVDQYFYWSVYSRISIDDDRDDDDKVHRQVRFILAC